MPLPFVLGSSSPGRKVILEDLGLSFTTVSPQFDERQMDCHDHPTVYTQKLALYKAFAVAHQIEDPEALIVTADTIVVYQGRVFNKPKDKQEAIDMLKILRNQTHSIVSSLAVLQNQKVLTGSEVSLVSLTNIPDDYLEAYIEAAGTLNTCGAYDIRRKGALIVQKIDGCSYNVQGLPIQTLKHLLLGFNIDLWSYVI
ncbi:Maf family nucleotide pyrophosphatase [Candidatus Chlamydia sanziniae]|uniref:Nucleoside triphosphate pyrophosphatase n=1 Tax=Candidatus Chlamydia sanziniae TaxID=1806891 RepID=A0A1A9HT95_9CHLA|nr:Maf family nucleotide pyrophosphatase [Candidatus Chlamydia sanziniae]ANH78208.1 Septum formation protein Maf [Candidatus Chlamydia sanziniae]